MNFYDLLALIEEKAEAAAREGRDCFARLEDLLGNRAIAILLDGAGMHCQRVVAILRIKALREQVEVRQIPQGSAVWEFLARQAALEISGLRMLYEDIHNL